MRDATISDVARVAGVSLRTVSRVLNGSPKVGRETQERIEAAIASLSFTPSARARALATRKSFLIGLIYDDRNALVLDEVQRGMVEVCGAQGFEVVIHPCHYHAPDLLEDIATFVRRSRVDGVIVIPPVSERPDIHETLVALGAPGVFITSVPAAGPALIAHEREAARRVARHLVDQGHRRLGFISGPPRFQSARERQIGFMDEIAASPGCEVLTEEGDYGFASGLSSATRLLRQPDRPSAIFACNDAMAAGVFKAAAQAGLSIPADLSVVGFDDSQIAEMLSPALTTIRRPMRGFAEVATHRLLALIDGRDPSPSPWGETVLELPLVLRESTRAPRS